MGSSAKVWDPMSSKQKTIKNLIGFLLLLAKEKLAPQKGAHSSRDR